MRGESIAHQTHLVVLGITVSKLRLDLVCPVHRGALGGYLDCPPPRQRLSAQQHVGRPDPFICVIVPPWLARLRGQGRARFLNELHRLCIQVDQRGPWIIGALRESQDIFPVGHNGGIGLRGKHPTLVPVRLADVFLRVCRTVA
jgi:hypothetical protein